MILAFTLLLATLSSYFNNVAIFCLTKNYIFDNSNFTRAHIAQSAEHFHGKEEAVCSIHTVGTRKADCIRAASLFVLKNIKLEHKKNNNIFFYNKIRYAL